MYLHCIAGENSLSVNSPSEVIVPSEVIHMLQTVRHYGRWGIETDICDYIPAYEQDGITCGTGSIWS